MYVIHWRLQFFQFELVLEVRETWKLILHLIGTLQARKALRALKGIVKLQAIIRGRAVRRQAMTTLKCLQSIINIQSHACARRLQTIEDAYYGDEHNEFENLRDKIIRVGLANGFHNVSKRKCVPFLHLGKSLHNVTFDEIVKFLDGFKQPKKVGWQPYFKERGRGHVSKQEGSYAQERTDKGILV